MKLKFSNFFDYVKNWHQYRLYVKNVDYYPKNRQLRPRDMYAAHRRFIKTEEIDDYYNSPIINRMYRKQKIRKLKEKFLNSIKGFLRYFNVGEK